MRIFGFKIKKRILSVPLVFILIFLFFYIFHEERGVEKKFSDSLKHKAEFVINGFKLFESLKEGRDWNLKASHAEIYKNTNLAILKDVNLTVYNNDGKIFKLFGDTATLNIKTKKVELADNVRAISDDGYIIRTNAATFYPDKQLLTSKSTIDFDGPELNITGKSFEALLEQKVVKIFQDVITKVKKQKNTGLIETQKLNTSDMELFIKSRLCVFDFINNRATYEKNVTGEGNGFKISTNKLIISYHMKNNERSIKEILALGNVKITKENKTALSERAILLTETKSITLTGNPSLNEKNSTLTGEKIVYNYFTEKFKVFSASGLYSTN